MCLGRPQSGGLFCDGDIQTLEIPFDNPDTDPGPAYGPVPRHLGHAWLRLDPSPPAPLASDNLVSFLEGFPFLRNFYTSAYAAARPCKEYFFVTYSGKAYSVDPGEKCNRYKRILASSVPKLPQLRPVIVRWSTLFRPRFAA